MQTYFFPLQRQLVYDYQSSMCMRVNEILGFQDGGTTEKIERILTGGKFSYPEFMEAVNETKQSSLVWFECLSLDLFMQTFYYNS
jgi:hypothetical protein